MLMIRVIVVVLTAMSPVVAAEDSPHATKGGAKPQATHARVPGKTWEKVASLIDAGWSKELLGETRAYSKRIGNLAVMIVEDGLVVDSWGDVTRETIVQSVRKSFMNALYGIAVSKKQIKLGATLYELGIDDAHPRLNRSEKQATVRDLLKSMSGVYHAAASTPDHIKRVMPKRGSHKHGEFWFYNNWDFNALETIYEKCTGADIYDAFHRLIAKPLGFEDFTPADGEVRREPVSIHAAHHFSMSARDMARFGLLYLRNGKWGGRQIIPAKWIKQSTRAYSGDDREGYGYLWWIQHRIRGFAARGGDAQLILVVPDRNLVFVTQVDRHDRRVPNWNEIGQLLSLVLKAKTG